MPSGRWAFEQRFLQTLSIFSAYDNVSKLFFLLHSVLCFPFPPPAVVACDKPIATTTAHSNCAILKKTPAQNQTLRLHLAMNSNKICLLMQDLFDPLERCFKICGPFFPKSFTQLSNLWRTPNSVSKGLIWKQALLDNSNDNLEPACESQVGFPLLWLKAYPTLAWSTVKKIWLETHI